MKATNLGIWYVQIPLQFVISPQGEVVEVKEHNGSKFVWVNRKRKVISSIPNTIENPWVWVIEFKVLSTTGKP